MEIRTEHIMMKYDELLAQANRAIVLLSAENVALKEELSKKEGEPNG